MKEQFEMIKTRMMVLVLVELVAIIIFSAFFEQHLYIVQFLFLLVNFILIFVIYYYMVQTYEERVFSVSKILGNEAKSAFEFGQLGILTFDSDYEITWNSELFDQLNDKIIGRNLFEVYPQLEELFQKKLEHKIIELDGRFFEVGNLNEDHILFFKDVSEEQDLRQKNKKNQIVFGIAHLDNYVETTQYEEEQTIAVIDTKIRQSVVNWADRHEMFIRRIRADRYLMVLNEEVFDNISKDRFSIVHQIRESARKIDANITLSLAFARQSESLKDLEDMSNKALEMAQSRGGDQVAINSGKDGLKYFGGSTESVEKRSKVRVRVIAERLGRLIDSSDQVIIMGHKMTDFDAFASSLGLSSIVSAYDKDAYIVLNKNDTEQMLGDAIANHADSLAERHRILSVEEAENILSEKTLLILTDHHNLAQTMSPEIVKSSKNIAIIDHHRRSDAYEFEPQLSYIESAASSASELVIELFPYHRNHVTMNKLDATFMYTGMLIDTNRFRNRSHSRTFEAAAELRKYGADLMEVENMLRDEYGSFSLKNQVLNTCQRFDDNYVIAAYKDKELPRPLMSQVADEIISVRDIEASFVVAWVADDTVAVSARSNGELNVQVVMERLGGGGHFTGAATQIKGRSINEVVEEIKEAVSIVRKER